MEFSSSYAAVALTAVAGKVMYSSVRHWWGARTLRQLYVARAGDIQNEFEVNIMATEGDEPTEVENLVDTKTKSVPRKHAGSFRHYLVNQGQAKFGCPARNEANRLVVRKHLYDVCLDAGLIARHINDHLDIATELVFVPSRKQLTALAIAHTDLTITRRMVSNDLGGPRATLA
jgi:hypothetical protein